MDIYKITNKLNGKIYIGKAKNGYESRFESHIKDAESNKSLDKLLVIDKAIRKYGKDNFICEKIDERSTIDELNNCEKFWIKELNAQDKAIGYNIADGGQGGDIFNTLTPERQKRAIEKRKTFFKDNPEEYEKFCYNRSITQQGKVLSDETKLKLSDIHKKLWDTNFDEMKEKCMKGLYTEEARLNHKKSLDDYWASVSEDRLKQLSNQGKRNWESNEYREKQSKTRKSKEYLDKMHSKHPNKGKINIYNKELDVIKRIYPEEFNTYAKEGYVRGTRPKTPEQKENCRLAALNRRSGKDGD